MPQRSRRLLTSSLAVLLALVVSVPVGAATGSVTLQWTAPGDDGVVGRASAYDLRYSLAPITAINFAAATRAVGVPFPAIAGSAESFTVTGLVIGQSYYFAIETADEVPNWSALSNVSQSGTSGTTAATPISMPVSFSLPRPDPARQSATWSYALPEAGDVSLEAFEVTGRHIRSITHGSQPAGAGEATWDLRDDGGRRVAPGVYLVRATLAGRSWVRRLVVIN